jgi:HK97 family phage prohead protease
MDRFTFASTGSMSGNTLEGVAHTYGERTMVNGRPVEFAPGAFDAALKKSDVRAFVNHDTTLLLGRQKNGTVRLSSEKDGLHYAIDLPDTTYAHDLRSLVERGDLSEMSFGIFPGKSEVRKASDGRGTPVLVHTEVSELFDISPVSLPAFGGTSIALHSAGRTDLATQLVRARHRVLQGERS